MRTFLVCYFALAVGLPAIWVAGMLWRTRLGTRSLESSDPSRRVEIHRARFATMNLRAGN